MIKMRITFRSTWKTKIEKIKNYNNIIVNVDGEEFGWLRKSLFDYYYFHIHGRDNNFTSSDHGITSDTLEGIKEKCKNWLKNNLVKEENA